MLGRGTLWVWHHRQHDLPLGGFRRRIRAGALHAIVWQGILHHAPHVGS